MDCVALLPMWAQPVVVFSAAQFSNGSGSTIKLESQFPNLFGTTGDYVEFDFLFTGSPASRYSFLGSTTTPDEIYSDLDSLFVTDGTTTAQVDFDATLSADTWYTIRVYNTGGTLYVSLDSIVQADTATPVVVEIDVIGKNQSAYTDVYSIQFRSVERSYLSAATPSATAQGADTGFWRFVAFELTEVGNHCIVDNLSGNDGYRIEVENVYLSTHKLKWTVGDGTTTTTKTSDELFYVGDTVFAYLDLEDLGETSPDAGDTTFEGTYSPNSGTLYVGSQAGTTNFCGLKLHTFLGDDGNLTTTESDWLINSGLGRAFDEIGASTTVSTSEVGFGYKFNETTGNRADTFGSDTLSETIGDLISATVNNGGFETLDAGTPVFDSWTEQYVSGSTTTVNAESSDVHAGTYSLRFDLPGGGQTRMKPNITVTAGKTYDFSVYAKITDATGSPTFSVKDENNGSLIGNNVFTITSTSYTEYTDTFTPTSDTLIMIKPDVSCAGESVYFDNFTVSAQSISRAFGLRSSFLNAGVFTGYLRNIEMHTDEFDASYLLRINADDYSIWENDGTASNVTFITTDPAA